MAQHINRAIEPPVKGFSQLSILPPEIIKLPNGIEIYAINSGEQPVNRITISYDYGIMNAAIPDALHLAVKLLREGTKSYSGIEISETLDFYGAWLKTNVYTGNTAISLWSPNKSTMHILPILKEILVAPTFPEKEFVTLREKRKANFLLSRKDVSSIASELDKQMVFGEKHPINRILDADEIEALGIDDLKTEYQRTFSRIPRVFVAGEIREILPHIIKFFEEFQFDNAQPFPYEIVPMAPCGGKTKSVDVDSEHQAAIVMSIPTIDRKHQDYIALRFVVMALGGYFGSRLMTNIREDKGYTYGIQANLLGYREGGVINISTDTATQYVDAVIKEVKYELQRLCEQAMTAEELNVVKSNAMTSLAAILDSPFSIMDYYISHFHNGTPENYLEKQIEVLNSLTADDVMALSRKYFRAENLLISIAKPAAANNIEI